MSVNFDDQIWCASDDFIWDTMDDVIWIPCFDNGLVKFIAKKQVYGFEIEGESHKFVADEQSFTIS